MVIEILLDYLTIATLCGAAIKTYRTIKDKSYKQSFNVLGGKDGGGGGGGYSPPAPPDPVATAKAQAAADRETAMTNALLLNPNIVGPYGNISYDTNEYDFGSSGSSGSSGGGRFADQNTGSKPTDKITRPTQTTTLSESQQKQLDARNQISEFLNRAGIGLAAQMPDTQLLAPTTPARQMSIDYSGVDNLKSLNDFQVDRQRVEQSVYDRNYRLLQPDIDQQERQLRERLIQTGNPLGSEAYNTELNRFERQRSEALQNLTDRSVLAGADEQTRLFNTANTIRQQQLEEAMRPYLTSNQIRGDAISENQLLRNQQINELSALLQGREAISLPVGAQYNQSALRSPDLAGMTMQNYQSQLNSYNQMYAAQQSAANQQSAATTSGLFSLGSSLAGLFF